MRHKHQLRFILRGTIAVIIAVVSGTASSQMLIRTVFYGSRWLPPVSVIRCELSSGSSPPVTGLVLHDEWQRFYDTFPLYWAHGYAVLCAIITLLTWTLLMPKGKRSQDYRHCGQCGYGGEL